MAKLDFNTVYVCKHCNKYATFSEGGIRSHNIKKHDTKKNRKDIDYYKDKLESHRHLLSSTSLAHLKRQGKRPYSFTGKYIGKGRKQGQHLITADTKSILVPCLIEIPINFGQVRFIQNGGI